MGSNEEQIHLLLSAHVDHVSYVLVLYSLAFVIYFCTDPKLSLTNSSHTVPNIVIHCYGAKFGIGHLEV